MAVESNLGPGPFFSLLLSYTVGRTPWTGISPSQSRYLHRTTQTQSKRKQIFMPRVGLEPRIPVFKRAKTFYALDRAATVIGLWSNRHHKFTKYVQCIDLYSSTFSQRKSVYNVNIFRSLEFNHYSMISDLCSSPLRNE
jgi:hypothetical protein